ncbi:MAG: phage tail protein [Oscillospiraceae bacterium]
MDGSITTNKGIALIGKLLAQKGALQITRVAVGDGTPPASPATLNALVHELKNATIESVDNPKNGEAKIVVTVSSIGVTQGFFVKEIGVFAKDTDGKEILYAYAGFSDNPQWIRPEGTAITNVATYDINTIIDRVSESRSLSTRRASPLRQTSPSWTTISALERKGCVKIYGVRWPRARAQAGRAHLFQRRHDGGGWCWQPDRHQRLDKAPVRRPSPLQRLRDTVRTFHVCIRG